MIYILILECFR